MIKSAIDTFRARTSCKIYAEISRALFLKFVCFCISCINLRITLIKWGGLLDLLISVGQVFIVPYIVVVVPLNICSVFFGFLNLPPCRPAHPLLYLMIFEQLEYPILLLLFLSDPLDPFFMFPLLLLLTINLLLTSLLLPTLLLFFLLHYHIRIHSHYILSL